MKLLNKVAIITGGNRGIGKAISLALAREGADIVIVHKGTVGAQEAINAIKEMGRECLVVKADVSKGNEIDDMVNKTIEKFGRIDILVNNAGIASLSRVTDLEEKEWDTVMNVNAKGVFLCCKAVAKQMIKQGEGGKIINVSSRAGKVGCLFSGHYCASKAAVIGLARTLALELAPHKINVNTICPGIVDTDMAKDSWKTEARLRGITYQEVRDELLSMIPLGRLAQPEDVAKLVVFLASEDADYMTGQSIYVTGGMGMD